MNCSPCSVVAERGNGPPSVVPPAELGLQSHPMDASHISLSDLRAFFRKQGLADDFAEQAPMLVWFRIAGEQMNRLTRPLRVRGDTLYVEVANSVVAQQLNLLKDDYLERINARLRERQLSDLRFRVGSFQPPTSDDEVDLEQLDLLKTGELSEALDEIDDPELRSVFEQWILTNARIDRRREVAGGQACPTCGVHHDETTELCYFCKLEQGHDPA